TPSPAPDRPRGSPTATRRFSLERARHLILSEIVRACDSPTRVVRPLRGRTGRPIARPSRLQATFDPAFASRPIDPEAARTRGSDCTDRLRGHGATRLQIKAGLRSRYGLIITLRVRGSIPPSNSRKEPCHATSAGPFRSFADGRHRGGRRRGSTRIGVAGRRPDLPL